MGEARTGALRVGFDRTIPLRFHGAKVRSDAGLFPYRDLDEAAGLTGSGASRLFDFRTGTNIQHSMAALLRQSIYSRLAGYEDVNDAQRLSVDPVMRHVIGGRAYRKRAASSSHVSRFETDVLTYPKNLAALMNMPGMWVDLIRQRRPIKKLILNMDSSVSETYGDQEGAAYNGHFGCDCYHPLFPFNQDGDVERVFTRRRGTDVSLGNPRHSCLPGQSEWRLGAESGAETVRIGLNDRGNLGGKRYNDTEESAEWSVNGKSQIVILDMTRSGY